MTAPQSDRDPLIERIVNRAIVADHRALGGTEPVGRRAVLVDPALGMRGCPAFVTDGEVRLSVETYEALRQLFYRQGFRWTDADPVRALRSAQALDALHAKSLLAALGGSDAPRPGAPVGTLAGHRFKSGLRELFRARGHGEWLKQLGVDRVAPDVAALSSPPAHPSAAPAMNVLAGYLAERGGVPAQTVLGELVQAGDRGQQRAARYAIEGYDPRLWEHVQGLGESGREAIVGRVLAPMERVLRGRSWRSSNAPEGEATPAAIRAAVGVHQAVLELAEAAGMREGAAGGRSLAREKAEYAVHGAYIAWAKTSGAGRAGAMAQRIAARAALVAVSAREQGASAAGLAGRHAAGAGRAGAMAASLLTASAGQHARRTAAGVARPIAAGLDRLQVSTRAGRSARDTIRKQVDQGGFGF